MKFKVCLALTLFLHLLVHPLLHAAEWQMCAPAQQRSVASMATATPSSPECAVCHMAGLLDFGRPVAKLTIKFSPDVTLVGAHETPTCELSPSQISPRAPPAI